MKKVHPTIGMVAEFLFVRTPLEKKDSPVRYPASLRIMQKLAVTCFSPFLAYKN